MVELTRLFHPAAEIIADFKQGHTSYVKMNNEKIFSMLRRRPCTSEEIAAVFGMHANEVSKYLGKLIRDGLIRMDLSQKRTYYVSIAKKKNNNVQV